MKSFYLFLIAALCGTALSAQLAPLADANPGTEDGSPTRMFPIGNLILYRVQSADEGVELWISDGTPEGTNLVKDINTDPSVSRGNSNPDGFTLFNGQVYLKAKDATNGDELWVTDGTEAGTVMVKDIQPGDGRGNPFDFIVFNDRLYFTANDGPNSSELWVSDGTEAGTEMVIDINPGSGPGNPNFKFAWRDELYFAANDGTNGIELWKSDGTAAGTSMVKDIRPDGNSSPSQFFDYDGELYFRANDGTTGTELWKTDGTEAGTVRVSDIQEGDGSSRPSDFFTVAGSLFFVADDGDGKELWISGGDSTNTNKAVDLNPEGDSNPREFTQTIDGDYWFVADTSDADASTVMYRIALGDNGLALGGFPTLLAALNGNDPEDLTFTGTSIYFSYDGENVGREMAFLNLINGRLFLAPEIAEGSLSSEIDEITLANNRIFFEAADTLLGKELYSAVASTARIAYALPDGTILGLGDTIDFGAVTPGFTAEDFLVIANTGTDTSLVTAATFAATNEPFDVDDSNFNGLLPPTPANWPVLPVTYSPTTTGEFMDTVVITSASQINDFFFFFLRGTTVVPDMSVAANGADLATAETVDFGDVPTGLDSTTTVTISNNGEGLLVLRSASLTSGMDFAASALSDTLAIGETATVDVTFQPTAAGDFSDELTLASNMADDFVVNLTGTAIVNSVHEDGLPTRAIYPNPVADRLTVELVSPLREGQWRIFSAVGKEVSRGIWPAGQSTHDLSIGELPAGVYHLELSSGTDRVTAKLIKQ